jgi:serine/threonine protein kinase
MRCPTGTFAIAGAVECAPCSAADADALQCPSSTFFAQYGVYADVLVGALCLFYISNAFGIWIYVRTKKAQNKHRDRSPRFWLLLAAVSGPIVWIFWSFYTRVYLEHVNQTALVASPKPAGLQNVDFIMRNHIDFAEFDEHIPHAPGSFGEISKGRWKGRLVAVKDILASKQMSDQDCLDFAKEATVMAGINHRHCVKLLGICSDSVIPMALVMEWMDGGNFYQALGRVTQPLPVHKRITVVRQITDAVQYLHSCSVVHGDIKSMNVMLTDMNSDGDAKLTDFGLSKIRVFSSTIGTLKNDPIAGTLHYMAPEMILYGKSSSPKSDVYAVGVLLYEAIQGKVPWHGYNQQQITSRLQNQQRAALQKPPGMSAEQFGGLERLYNDCCNHSPDLRPTASEVATRLAALDVNNPDNNVEVQLLPANFKSMCQTPESCLRLIYSGADAALNQLYSRAILFITEHLRDGNRQRFIIDHDLSPIEAFCIALYTWEPSDQSANAPYKVFNFACRTRDRYMLERWQHFSFHFLNGLR